MAEGLPACPYDQQGKLVEDEKMSASTRGETVMRCVRAMHGAVSSGAGLLMAITRAPYRP